jgi:hypothetical protein
MEKKEVKKVGKKARRKRVKIIGIKEVKAPIEVNLSYIKCPHCKVTVWLGPADLMKRLVEWANTPRWKEIKLRKSFFK